MYIVGLTGGIGSGKTAAAERFSVHRVTVINADQVAREVVEPGTHALKQIADKFGSSVLTDEGSLDRAALRNHVFGNDANRDWLEQLLHPLIAEATRARQRAPRTAEEPPYRILESPLLIEAGRAAEVDRVLLVDTHRETQIARVMARDNCNREQAEAILAAQMSGEEKRAHAHDILDNTSTLESLHAVVDRLHDRYCELALAKMRSAS